MFYIHACRKSSDLLSTTQRSNKKRRWSESLRVWHRAPAHAALTVELAVATTAHAASQSAVQERARSKQDIATDRQTLQTPYKFQAISVRAARRFARLALAPHAVCMHARRINTAHVLRIPAIRSRNNVDQSMRRHKPHTDGNSSNPVCSRNEPGLAASVNQSSSVNHSDSFSEVRHHLYT